MCCYPCDIENFPDFHSRIKANTLSSIICHRRINPYDNAKLEKIYQTFNTTPIKKGLVRKYDRAINKNLF